MGNKDTNTEKLKKFDLQRRVVSHMTSTSWKNIPHVSYLYESDITDFYSEFIKLSNARGREGYKVTFNTIMIKVILEGLSQAPELNSYLDYNYKKNEGVLHFLNGINVSIPWLLKDGKMITPTILNAEKMSLNQICDYVSNIAKRIEKTNIDEVLYKSVTEYTLNELKKLNFSILRSIIASRVSKNKITGLQGQEKKEYYNIPEKERLTPKDITSGTVTVSNIGSLYKEQRGNFALLEIIPPQVFAVGISSIQERPGVYYNSNGNKEIGIRKVIPMCLVFDHRAIDFSSIVPFIKKLDKIFEKPNVIYRW